MSYILSHIRHLQNIIYKYNLKSKSIRLLPFTSSYLLNMTDLSNDNEQVDNERSREYVSLPEKAHRNHLRLQSFVDRYGTEDPQVSPGGRVKNYVRKKCSSLTFEYCINAFFNKIPLIRCLKEYKIRKNLFGDIIAGITVAIMHIPQGMAYGVLTTLPPIHGKR